MNGEFFPQVIVGDFTKVSNWYFAVFILELNDELYQDMQTKNDLKYENWGYKLRMIPFNGRVIEYGDVSVVIGRN